MTDLELAVAMTTLLPEEHREKLTGSFDRFERDMKLLAPDSTDCQQRFCQYMEIYWLAVYDRQNEYSKLQKRNYGEWRKRAENVYSKLQRKAVTA